MNDAKFNYGLFALKNGAEIDKSISALPDSKTKKEKAMPVAAEEPDEDEESISALPEDEDIIDEKELKRNRIKSLIKLAVIGVSIIIIIIISTIAWFTMNREVENNGLAMTATDQLFTISHMTNTYSAETTVTFYWVWVETLSELVLDDNNAAHKRNLRGKKSICSDQSETIRFLKNHPSWFLLDPDNPSKTWTEFTDSTPDATVVNTINNNYTLYSSFYNEADQCIGTNVAYLMLDLSADGTATPAP